MINGNFYGAVGLNGRKIYGLERTKELYEANRQLQNYVIDNNIYERAKEIGFAAGVFGSIAVVDIGYETSDYISMLGVPINIPKNYLDKLDNSVVNVGYVELTVLDNELYDKVVCTGIASRVIGSLLHGELLHHAYLYLTEDITKDEVTDIISKAVNREKEVKVVKVVYPNKVQYMLCTRTNCIKIKQEEAKILGIEALSHHEIKSYELTPFNYTNVKKNKLVQDVCYDVQKRETKKENTAQHKNESVKGSNCESKSIGEADVMINNVLEQLQLRMQDMCNEYMEKIKSELMAYLK